MTSPCYFKGARIRESKDEKLGPGKKKADKKHLPFLETPTNLRA